MVNKALSLLGTRPLTSLEDEGDVALTMKTHYYIERDAMLEEVDWSFSIRRFTPARLAAAPDFGFPNAFAIPSDIMRIITVDYSADAFNISRSASQPSRTQAEYVVESGQILTDREVIYCRGIRRMEDEGNYSSLFASAFALRLAMAACYQITKSNKRFEHIAGMYTGVMDDAISMDGLQGRHVRISQNNLLNARSHNGSRL